MQKSYVDRNLNDVWKYIKVMQEQINNLTGTLLQNKLITQSQALKIAEPTKKYLEEVDGR